MFESLIWLDPERTQHKPGSCRDVPLSRRAPNTRPPVVHAEMSRSRGGRLTQDHRCGWPWRADPRQDNHWLAKGQKSDWPSVLSLARVIFHIILWEGASRHGNVLPHTCFQCACFWYATHLSSPLSRYTVRVLLIRDTSLLPTVTLHSARAFDTRHISPPHCHATQCACFWYATHLSSPLSRYTVRAVSYLCSVPNQSVRLSQGDTHFKAYS